MGETVALAIPLSSACPYSQRDTIHGIRDRLNICLAGPVAGDKDKTTASHQSLALISNSAEHSLKKDEMLADKRKIAYRS